MTTVVQRGGLRQPYIRLDHETRSDAEAAVVVGLQRVREGLRGGLTFGTNVVIEVKAGRFFVADVLFCHAGAAGVIEVDGPHHRGRLANDFTRHMLIEECGVARVFPLPVEATNDPEQLDAYLRMFLRRLTRLY